MKHTTIILTLLFLTFVTFNLACDGKSNINLAPSPTPTVKPSPSPKSSPTPRSGNLVEATSSGDIGYELAGVGNAATMNLTVRNKTERVWEVKIEVGTKIEPDDGDVQQMVVTKEIEVHLEPHDHKSLKIEVSCLDISKAAPSNMDTSWRFESSKNLAQFIRCSNDVVDDLKAEGEVNEKNRRGWIQFALWQARGATHDDWIEYYETYGPASPEQAEQLIEERKPTIKRITDRCPAL